MLKLHIIDVRKYREASFYFPASYVMKSIIQCLTFFPIVGREGKMLFLNPVLKLCWIRPEVEKPLITINLDQFSMFRDYWYHLLYTSKSFWNHHMGISIITVWFILDISHMKGYLGIVPYTKELTMNIQNLSFYISRV